MLPYEIQIQSNFLSSCAQIFFRHFMEKVHVNACSISQWSQMQLFEMTLLLFLIRHCILWTNTFLAAFDQQSIFIFPKYILKHCFSKKLKYQKNIEMELIFYLFRFQYKLLFDRTSNQLKIAFFISFLICKCYLYLFSKLHQYIFPLGFYFHNLVSQYCEVRTSYLSTL